MMHQFIRQLTFISMKLYRAIEDVSKPVYTSCKNEKSSEVGPFKKETKIMNLRFIINF